MKLSYSRLIIFLLMCCFAVTQASAFQKPAPPQTASPETVVREFYQWYIQTLNKNEEPFKKKTFVSKYATARLIAWLTKVTTGDDPLDYDYFLNAQDWGENWDKDINISSVVMQPNIAKLVVSFGNPSDPDHKLRVTLKKESGVWKIDKVDAVEEPQTGHL
ncbi:MAG TPA: DUF3828 domain-containing protein [Blastocatellia bacterium]|nr:DUF3828 domain-containing protein [Blastocatellia bacterium]